MKKKDYQHLFPKKKLTKEENDWCHTYEGSTMFEPIYTDEVSFLQMIERNHQWLEDHVSDAIHSSDTAKRKINYYEKIIYGK